MTIGLNVTMFIKIGYESTRWAQVDFVFAYSTCVLTFIQFLIRYFAITHLYKTEASILGWAISFLIFITSLISIQATLHIPTWFLSYGILLLSASFKTVQSRKQIAAASKSNVERLRRLQEFMIFESSFGVFMILFFLLSRDGTSIKPFLTIESTAFFGTFFAAFYSLVSTIINIIRVSSNRSVIEKRMKALP